MASLTRLLRRADAYGKVDGEFMKRTTSGAIVTLVATAIIVMLTASEVLDYLAIETVTELGVDNSREKKMDIFMDITFPSLPCGVLSLDSLDSLGKHELNVVKNIIKSRLNKDGHVVGQESLPDYQGHHHGQHRRLLAEDNEEERSEKDKDEDKNEEDGDEEWVNPYDAQRADPEREAMKAKLMEQQGEGCNINGFLTVNKVAGNFHISVHSSDIDVLDSVFHGFENINMSHKINQLHFGPQIPGIRNALDGEEHILDKHTGMFDYSVKVVPTFFTDVHGEQTRSNQFSVAMEFQSMQVVESLPAVYFRYDLSPIMVNIHEKRTKFSHFLTHLCAIVGGVYTVSSIIDSFLYHSLSTITKKAQLNKLG